MSAAETNMSDTAAATALPVEHKENGEAAAAAAATTTAAAAAPAAASTAASPLTLDVPPSQTLYVNNLNEKIKKDELKKSLYFIFGQYGNIVEINCNNTYKMRGQAWIVFDAINSATRAQRELSNFSFFGKPMRITFAKTKSDVLAKLDGTFQVRAKRKGPEDNRPKKGSAGQPAAKKQKKAPAEATPAAAPAAAVAAPPQPAAAMAVLNEPPPPPHRILFVENLPPQANDMMLGMLFQQYAGFKEARVIAGKGVAFVEFDEIFQAATAMEALQAFKITATHLMKITFAKK